MSYRVENLRKEMDLANLECVLISKPENRRYISGFTGSTGHVLITKNKTLFITDFRYIEQAQEECTGYEIKKVDTSYTIYDILSELQVKSIAIEEDYATYEFVNTLKNKANLDIIPLKGLITKLRMIKDQAEIDLVREAANITDKAFEHILGYIKVGMTEKEVANELEHFMKKNGADGPSFTFIVASGNRSSMPHGVASEKVIEDGDFVTIDMGCRYKGYCSDMTRTFVMGKATERQKEIYEIVLSAEETVLQSIRPGITGFDLDKIARDIITSKGYGENFGHSLGHGVGLEVHELPRLVQLEAGKIQLEPNMIITDEPGIYISGFGGVRIEDLVVVTETGCDVLSKSTKKLLEVNN